MPQLPDLGSPVPGTEVIKVAKVSSPNPDPIQVSLHLRRFFQSSSTLSELVVGSGMARY